MPIILDNLSGWTESLHLQLDYPYPRKGAFDNFHMTQMNDMVNGEMEDPKRDYKYMKEAASAWKKCKPLWNKSHSLICCNVVH